MSKIHTLSSAKYDETVKLLNEGNLSQSEIARRLGVSQPWVSHVKLGEAKRHDDEKIKKLEAEIPQERKHAVEKMNERLRRENREIKRMYEEIKKELDVRKALRDVSSIFVAKDFKIKVHKRKEATAFALLSDWHVDEVVKAQEIGGINEFNDSICSKRVEELFDVIITLLDMCKSRSEIDTLVIGALGDFVSGYLHLDLIESNVMTPTEAVKKSVELLMSVIDSVLKSKRVKKIIFSGSVGNHGRITIKPPTKKSAEKNYEWLIYEFLVMLYAERGEKRIRFILPEGMFNWLDVYGFRIRFSHGDGIKYMGGVGGVHIPLRKAIAQWNKAMRADLDCMGHWHTRESSKDYCINGSLIGYNQYAMRIKADYEKPQQSFFIMHPKYGKTAEFPMVLE